ncbi:SDR family NAD(P)-dependent oxidoreductase [Actinomadura latina]|uniref:SDR family NAD(P)-dependent oxidoreductase n=2 Tax=Actinomadura latina TaxID=163603 RepID=A0A846Z0D4_9ACTN|nr:SDR family NAD(P)-dependent oxidoreductase [Actinomadura latina]
MSRGHPAPGEIIGAAPSGRPEPHLAVAVARAGGTGVLDLGADRAPALAALADVRRWWTGPFGVRVRPGCGVRAAEIPPAAATVVVDAAALAADGWLDVAGIARGRRLLIEVADPADAAAAVRAGRGLTDDVGIIARGGEGGDLTTFILLQRLLADVDVPVYAAGGIGPHTAAAAVAGGAAGVVLDEQLARVREMDPSGHDAAAPHDAAVPALAHRYRTAGGVVRAVREQIVAHLRAAVRVEPLAPRPDPVVVQGPMTQVSDRSAFAGAVAQEGGLPFLALGPMDAGRVRALLRETADRLGGRPWGAGIPGNAPPELRAEQLAAVRAARPPYAIIGAGRPAEAAPLEAAGISVYLQVPSPEPLGRFLDEGARKFVFAGGECGGPVGPHASFPLWDAQVERLMAFGGDAGELSVMFGGGVHDERSAAMVAALAGPLAARGAAIRVLMGTAYLFTPEAVAAGAIMPGYQDVALACAATVLLETAPGQAIRCARTPYTETFEETRRELEQAGTPRQEVRRRLEKLNAGRLHLASRGLRLDLPVDPVRQRSEGMYAMGQVAVLRSARTGIAALHEQVTAGATAFLAARAAELGIGAHEPGGDAPSPADIAIIGMGCVLPGARDADGYWANIVGGAEAASPSLPDVPFDAEAHGIAPDALGGIDPIQLLSLETASRALRDAGYADRPFDRSRTSVFFAAEGGGDLGTAYALRATLPAYFGGLPPGLDEQLPHPAGESLDGVRPGAVAARIADRLGLGGAACTVAASSLAALDAACKDLAAGSSAMVLCGGAHLCDRVHGQPPPPSGEGVACVVLKRLADAERDGDRIYAVVRSVAGSTGRPALDRAHERAGVPPSAVGLAETDGRAGLIKAAYALHTGVLPGTSERGARPWPVRPGERFAGVGGAGVGRAHFHAVLSGYEGAPEPVSGLAEWPAELFLIRAGDRAAAREEIDRLSRLLDGEPRLRDLARTAASLEGPVQAAFAASGPDDLREKLALAARFRPAPGVHIGPGEPGQVAFLFPGEDGRPGMLADLFAAFPRLQRLLRLAGGRHEGTGIAGLAVHRLLTAVGVHPDLAAGQGQGELAALCAAGVIDDTGMIEVGAACAGATPSRDDLLGRDLRSPAFPVWANTTARPYETGPSDLAAAPAAPVRVAEQIEAMYGAGARTFVDTGPGRALAELAGTVLGDRPHTAVSCAAPGENGLVALLRALAELAAAGVPVDPLPLFAGRGAHPLTGPPAAPGWLVNGHHVRTAGGDYPAGALRPPERVADVRPADPAVLAYLRTGREIIAAQREVVLRHLAAPVPAARPDPPAEPPRPSVPPPARTGAHVRTMALSGGPAPAAREEPAAEAAAVPAGRREADRQVWPRPEAPIARRVVRRVPRVVDLDPLPAPPESGTAFAGRRFVLVDDGCGIALELGGLLERHGAQARTAQDADGPCDGLVHLAALRPGAASVLPRAFAGIGRALSGDPRWVVLASGAGGTFGRGFHGGVVGDPVPGAGLRGLARTVARERPEALVRALDLDTEDTPRAIARRIMAELLAAGAPVVVGHEGGLRRGLELPPSGPPDGDGGPEIGRDGVVLLTGGEHGVAARTALELARTSGCHIELMGRAPESDMTLEALREHAASVRYHAGDAQDPQALRNAVENVRLTHRRLDGVIHAAALAGTPEEPDQAYRAKVDSAAALAEALPPDAGFFVVLCGLAGAPGDRGRAGDAAADDACGTLAHAWRRRLRGRVLVAGLDPCALSDPDACAAALLREIAGGGETHVALTGEVR